MFQLPRKCNCFQQSVLVIPSILQQSKSVSEAIPSGYPHQACRSVLTLGRLDLPGPIVAPEELRGFFLVNAGLDPPQETNRP